MSLVKASKNSKKYINDLAAKLAPIYYGVMPFYNKKTGEFFNPKDKNEEKEYVKSIAENHETMKKMGTIYSFLKSSAVSDAAIEGLEIKHDEGRHYFARIEQIEKSLEKVDISKIYSEFVRYINGSSKDLVSRSEIASYEIFTSAFSALKGLMGKTAYSRMINKMFAKNIKDETEKSAAMKEGLDIFFTAVNSKFKDLTESGADEFKFYKEACNDVIKGMSKYSKDNHFLEQVKEKFEKEIFIEDKKKKRI